MRASNYCSSVTWIILILTSLSCTRPSESKLVYTEFQEVDSLIGKRVGPANFFLQPRQIVVIDSLIMIYDNKTDLLFHILDSNRFNIKMSFGTRGRGPGEFIAPEVSKRATSNNLLILNSAYFYCSNFEVDSISRISNYTPERKMFFPPGLIIPYSIFQINDTIIIGSTTSGTTRLFKLNIQTQEFIETGINVEFNTEYDRGDLGQMLYSTNDYNSTNDKIVSVMRFFDRLDIYNSDLSIKKTILRSGNQVPSFYENNGEWLSDKTKFYYIDVFTTKDYIYALYCGEDYYTATPNIGKYLQVFSWKGVPIIEYKLSIGLSSIYVSPDDQRLIGINMHDDQPIALFDLKHD